ncbi:hypothetical protein ABC418_17200 [Lactiplantibacillus plantarum]|uniref:hypothetical protein n=1 Tax=Lactiplantibacillus plantarum TaxID=1590 RepID=UPI003965C594
MNVGTLIEVSGKAFGQIEMITENTLLVRRILITYDSRGRKVAGLLPEAVYIDRKLIESSYWVKAIDSNLPIISESINLVDGIQLIQKCFNV